MIHLTSKNIYKKTESRSFQEFWAQSNWKLPALRCLTCWNTCFSNVTRHLGVMTLKVGIRSKSYGQCMACSYKTLELDILSSSGTSDNIQQSHRPLAICGIQRQLTWSLPSMGVPSWCHLSKQTKDSLKTAFGSMLISRTLDPSLSAYRALWLYGM